MLRACLATTLTCLISLITTSIFAADSCAPVRIDSTTVIDSVVDGDTIRLSNGSTLRIIGINTPELYPVAQQGALQAKRALKQLLKKHHNRIRIQFGVQQQDHYGRQLGHIFLPDNTNVTSWLLRQGLGHWIAVGDNLAYLQCYQDAEEMARIKRRNLWGRLPKNFIRAEDLTAKSTGFYIITGTLARAFETDISVWLEVKPNLRLHLDKRKLGNFSSQPYVQMIGDTLMTRGWVYTSRNKSMIKISHPSLIQFEPF